MTIIVGTKLNKLSDGSLMFYCPGCNSAHRVTVGHDGWRWNGSGDAPTFHPSILVRGRERLTDDEYNQVMAGHAVEKKETVCHSFVSGGNIRFLSDCTHSMSGQTVQIPDWKLEK